MSITQKRKQDNIDEEEFRHHVLKVRLNSEELKILDLIKGRHSRAVAVRFLVMSEIPAKVPALNQQAWRDLSKSASNLNQISHKLNIGELPEIAEIRRELEIFREGLLGAKNE